MTSIYFELLDLETFLDKFPIVSLEQQNYYLDYILDDYPLELTNFNVILSSYKSNLIQVLRKLPSELLLRERGGEEALEQVSSLLTRLNANELDLIYQKFPQIIRNCQWDTLLMTFIQKITSSSSLVKCQLLSFLYWFLTCDIDSGVGIDFVDASVTIPNFYAYLMDFLSESDLETVTFLMLTLNFHISSKDLHNLYSRHGSDNRLFNILCHFDFQISDMSDDNIDIVARFITDPHLTVEAFLRSAPLFYSIDLEYLGQFSAFVGSYRHCLDCHDPDRYYREVVGKLPTFPSLVELSRDVARAFLVSTFRVRKCWQFHTLLKFLPIPKICEDILTFKKTVY